MHRSCNQLHCNLLHREDRPGTVTKAMEGRTVMVVTIIKIPKLWRVNLGEKRAAI